MGESRKSAFVTGASSGIGYAVAIELAKNGYLVFAGARRVDRMKPLEDLGIITLSLDVSSPESILEAVAFISERSGGKLDILFNNAGTQCKAPGIEITDDKIEHCFRVNVFGVLALVREFSSLVVKAQGIIAFTGSTAGINPFPFSSVYSATKGAIHAYASTLALELKPLGVNVHVVLTGGVYTEIGDKYELTPDSYYRNNGVDSLNTRVMKPGGTRLTAPVYAERVVRDFKYVQKKLFFKLSSNFYITYRGSESTMHRYLSLMPRWFIERKLVRDHQLAEVYLQISVKRKYL